MILQTGFRTDIPGFYSTWFANRLRAGFVLVRNPYNPQSVTRYAINPDVVDLIGFCTKNPAPMLPRMELLRPYGQYWFVTITPYGPEIEPHVRDVFLLWLSKALENKHFRGKTESGEIYYIENADTKEICMLHAKDGILQMPAYTIRFEEKE